MGQLSPLALPLEVIFLEDELLAQEDMTETLPWGRGAWEGRFEGPRGRPGRGGAVLFPCSCKPDLLTHGPFPHGGAQEVTGGWRGPCREEAAQALFSICPGRSALPALPGIDPSTFLPSKIGTTGGNLYCEMGELNAVTFGSGNGDPKPSFPGHFNGQNWL